MDIVENDTFRKIHMYGLPSPIFDNFNIALNSSNSMVVHWNKYQIFVYENLNFAETLKEITPDYLIHSVLLTNNYLLCVDTNGNVHITTLKFKDTGKLLKSSFQPRDSGIKTCITYSQDRSLCLKHDSGTYFLCMNEIGTNFRLEKTVAVIYNNGSPPVSSENYFLKTHKIDQKLSRQMMKIFNVEILSENCNLIVLSFDKLTVLGCLFDPTMNEDTTNLVTLYTCPSEICDVVIEDTHLHIGLKIGTVVRLPLNSGDKEEIVHLNSALHRFAVENEAYIYTDGIGMWKADNIYTEITFKQFVLKNIFDFTVFADFVLCTTFDKTNHNISFLDEDSFHKPVDQEYSSAEQVMNNSEYLNKIFEEVDKDRELAKKMNEEWYYLNALSLTKRHDLMDKAIETNVQVYESYLEVINKTPELTLTEDISQFFGAEIFLFKIEITVAENQKAISDIVTEILANVDTQLHITISNEHKTLKTTSIKVKKLKKVNFLVPCQLDSTKINMNIKLVTRIPDNYDKKQTIWTILYNNDIAINSEQFIRTDMKGTNCLKKPKESLEELIMKTSTNQYGDLFNFTDISKQNYNYSMYVNWPENFDLKSKSGYLSKIFGSNKSDFLIQQLSSKEFLDSKSSVSLTVSDEEVDVAIENDGFSTPQLKVTGGNMKTVLDFRNFFSTMIYESEGTKLINCSYYTTVENIQKEVKACITEPLGSESMERLIHRFEKNVVGVLPI